MMSESKKAVQEIKTGRKLADLQSPWQDYYARRRRRSRVPEGEVMSEIPKRFFTIGQAADLLGVSVSYLRKLEKQGVVSFARLGSHRRITEEDILTLQNYLGVPSVRRANKGVAYIRTALSPQSVGAEDDVSEQRARLLQYLNSLPDDPVHKIMLDDEDIIVDYAGSADLALRPGLRRLLDRALHQDVTHILVVSADRLSLTDGGTLVAVLRALGKTVVAVDPDYPILTTEVIGDFDTYLRWFLTTQLHLDLDSPGPDQSFYEQMRILFSRFVSSRFTRIVGRRRL